VFQSRFILADMMCFMFFNCVRFLCSVLCGLFGLLIFTEYALEFTWLCHPNGHRVCLSGAWTWKSY